MGTTRPRDPASGPSGSAQVGTGPSLPGEEARRLWTGGTLFVDVLPSRDLGNSSFVVGDVRHGVAAVVDPTRDIGRYLDRIAEAGLSLSWVLDTHLHADFVSGGLELARTAGAEFGLGSEARTAVPHRPLDDGQEIEVGAARLVVVGSPGHSPEHVSFLLRDPSGRPRVLLSGGSLMAGSAGRPDLLGPSTAYRLVQDEYETLHVRYSKLPSATVVLPTHVGGSFCGVGTRETPATTLGRERRTNPLFRASDRSRFTATYLSAAPFPRYYRAVRRINEIGIPPLGRDIPPLRGLSAEEVDAARREPGTTVLDVRSSREFSARHVPGSLSVPIDGAFSAWVGWLRPVEETFVLVDDDPSARRQAQVDLLRIGVDRIRGYLDGGVESYVRSGFPASSTERTTMRSVRRAIERGDSLILLDTRNPHEVAEGRLPGAVNIPLPELPGSARALLERTAPVYVHCQSGRRAGIAASVLEQLGFPEVRLIVDGPDAWGPAPRPRRSRRKGGRR